MAFLAGRGIEWRPGRFGKYGVTFDVWPAGYTFPDFCQGPATLISKSAVLSLLETRLKLNFAFDLEDVLFTGIYREMAGIHSPAQFAYIGDLGGLTHSI